MTSDRSRNKYFFLAFLLQFGVLAICICLHRIFISLGDPVQEITLVDDALTSPTLGRLIYAIISALLFFVLTALASRKAESGKTLAPFVLGAFAGTFLWQCIGEDLWNFSLGGEHFLMLEGAAALPFAVLFVALLLYCFKHKSLDWGVWCALLAFSINWYGHVVLSGLYPFVSGIFSVATWYMIAGLIIGIILFVAGFYLGLRKTRSPKGKILASMLCYFGVALIAFGIIGA